MLWWCSQQIPAKTLIWLNVDVLSKRWSRRDDYRRPEILRVGECCYSPRVLCYSPLQCTPAVSSHTRLGCLGFCGIRAGRRRTRCSAAMGWWTLWATCIVTEWWVSCLERVHGVTLLATCGDERRVEVWKFVVGLTGVRAGIMWDLLSVMSRWHICLCEELAAYACMLVLSVVSVWQEWEPEWLWVI